MDTIISHFGFDAETQVPLLDGRDLTIAALLQEFGTSQSFWIYSCDSLGNIYPRLARLDSEIASQCPALKITLDSRDYFHCAEDQQIMRRDGTYVKAKEVKVKESLMPLYRKIDDKRLKGYEMVLSQITHRWNYTHRLSASKDGRYKKSVVHHINFNKRDNRPDNLQCMSWEAHTKLHMEQSDLLNAYAVSPEGRAKSSEIMSAHWDNEEWRKKQIELNRTNGIKVSWRLRSEGRLGFQTMDKERHSQRSRENAIERNAYLQLRTPEAQKKAAEMQRMKIATDEEFAHKKSEQARKNFAEYNRRMVNGEVKPNEKQIEARRQNMKKLAENKELRMRACRKTAWTRFHKERYPTFEEYLQSLESKPDNHKIAQIEYIEPRDTYMLAVENGLSFALLAGVFVR